MPALRLDAGDQLLSTEQALTLLEGQVRHSRTIRTGVAASPDKPSALLRRAYASPLNCTSPSKPHKHGPVNRQTIQLAYHFAVRWDWQT